MDGGISTLDSRRVGRSRLEREFAIGQELDTDVIPQQLRLGGPKGRDRDATAFLHMVYCGLLLSTYVAARFRGDS
jgi:hypothetical protein